MLADRCSLVLGFLHAGFLLVFLPAPAALGEGFSPSLLHDGLPLAVVGLLRGDEVDARVVMLGVVPVEVPGEVGHGLAVIQEPPRVFRGALGGAEGRLDEGVVVGCPRTGEQLRHPVVFTEPLDRLGLHLTAAVVDDLRPLVFGQVEDVLVGQTTLEQPSGFLGGLCPGDAPLDGLPGPLVQEQVEVKVLPLLVGHQIADVPAPALVGSGEFLPDGRLRLAVVAAPSTASRHEALFP